MERYAMSVRLRSEHEEAYKAIHKEVWPEVLSKITECNIHNYSIFLRDGVLISYFEYSGSDFKADMATMAAHPKTQQWWSITNPMQDPFADRLDGEWWVRLEEVFHLE